MKQPAPLHQSTILITRPKHQAAAFQHMLENAGANVILFPTLEIIPVKPDTTTLNTPKINIIIFTSPNAVTHSLPYLQQSSIDLTSPHTAIAAIGKKTAETLQQASIPITLAPEKDFNSEALLNLDALKTLNDKTILICKGEGGRELLATTLKQRGAIVKTLDCYQRQCPKPSEKSLQQLHSQKIDIITLTSVETAENLFHLLQEQTWINTPILLAGSPRIHDALIKSGIKNTLWTANNPSDKAMYQTLLTHWKKLT